MADKRIDAYRTISIRAQVDSSSPAQLIVLLFDGLLVSLTDAKIAIEKRDYSLKGQCFSKSLTILAALRESLDKSVGGDFPHDVDRLYDYMQRRIIEVNQNLNTVIIDEIIDLTLTLKSGWDQISSRS